MSDPAVEQGGPSAADPVQLLDETQKQTEGWVEGVKKSSETNQSTAQMMAEYSERRAKMREKLEKAKQVVEIHVTECCAYVCTFMCVCVYVCACVWCICVFSHCDSVWRSDEVEVETLVGPAAGLLVVQEVQQGILALCVRVNNVLFLL